MESSLPGLLGLACLVADVWAILNIAQASLANSRKFSWMLLVVVLPFIGVLIWWRRGPHAPRVKQ